MRIPNLGKDLKRIEMLTSCEQNLPVHEEADQFQIKLRRNITCKEFVSYLQNHVFIAYLATQVYYYEEILQGYDIRFIYACYRVQRSKSEIDLHHIFSKQYLLETYGMKGIDDTYINQVARKFTVMALIIKSLVANLQLNMYNSS